MTRLIGTLVCAVILLGGPAVRAEDEARIQELEREVADLKVLVHDLMQDREAAHAADSSHAADAGMSHGSGGGSAPPRLTLRGFGDLDYVATRDDPSDGSASASNGFVDGTLDLFVTSQLAEQLDFVSEIGFEFEEDGETEVDVERLLLRWAPRDWMNVAAGRGHTSLGYWNQEFHHGTWMQTTVDRPLVFRFEDDGGILPMHYVGLELSGNLETSQGLLSYSTNLANGRADVPGEVQVAGDRNDSKAFGGMLRFHPLAVEGLAVGVNAMHDVIPREEGVAARAGDIEEQIAGFHVIYTEDPFEVLLENQFIRHQDQTQNQSFDSLGGYLQLAYRFGRWKPYYRLDWLRLADDDPYFAGVPEAEDTIGHTVGVRYDWRTWAALKLELNQFLARSSDAQQGSAQVSFAF